MSVILRLHHQDVVLNLQNETAILVIEFHLEAKAAEVKNEIK
jgi:hypothetical protein